MTKPPSYRWLALVPGFGLIVLLLIGVQSGARWMPRCYLNDWTGLHCAGCGMTRATRSLLEGDFLAALDYNIVGVLLGPIVLVGAGREFIAWASGRDEWRWRLPWKWSIVLAVVVIGFGVLRNLPGFDFLAPGGLSWIG